MRWIARVLAAAFVLAAGMGSAQAPATKLALAIGVGDYGRDRAAQEAAGFLVPPALTNAVRDSATVADALEAQGYRVTRLANPDKRAMLAAVNTFAAALTAAGPDAVGVLYFAGHGAQGRPALERDIDNYLIPIGADLVTEVDLESEALALSRVSATLRPGPRGAVVLILDACRDFALPAPNRSGLATRGLAEAKAAPGTLIAYSTSPGSTAVDGAPGAGGPYANALAAELRAARGASLTDLFNTVRNRVLADTRDTQLPWENSSLRRSVTMGLAPAAMTGPVVDNRPAPPAPTTPGAEFRDCPDCPLMVVVPAGSFMMGSPESEAGRSGGERRAAHNGDEGPQHRVTIAQSFAVGKFEVTFAEWDACAAAGGCAPEELEPYRPNDEGWGRANHPVMNVSWEDARRYVRWLNGKVGGHAYRLPSEAEWEYAARAGTTTAFSTGSMITPAQAQFQHTHSYAGSPTLAQAAFRTAPVGTFAPNAFKLHDMHGNVWEWVGDCYADSYAGAPTDGSANVNNSCEGRVLRGGSWYDDPKSLRSAARTRFASSDRGGIFGFRLARTLLSPAP